MSTFTSTAQSEECNANNNAAAGGSKSAPPVSLQSMSLSELFAEKNLKIPDYQRSYSWRSNHVEDLLKDICERKTTYLMGTVILHDLGDDKGYDIVDGQQRLVTLTVLLHTLQQQLPSHQFKLPLLNGKFSTGAAKAIRETRDTIKAFLTSKSEEWEAIFKFLTSDSLDADRNENAHLQFHVLKLSGPDALDRAYTFFDSVNSKGKSLSDFDLLKAHHLMYIPSAREALATSHNDEWLRRNDEVHRTLFSETLRRLRMWARGLERDDKQEWPDYNEFLPVVEPSTDDDVEHLFNRYMQPVAFRSWRRVGDQIVLSMDYPVTDGETMIPMEINQTIEGGDAFFLFAKRYHRLYEVLFTPNQTATPSTAIIFVRTLGCNIDNAYLSNAFRAAILLYVDKFGEDRLIESSVCIERIISAWRWAARSVRIEGTLTHVRNVRLIPTLLDSVNARHAFEQLLKRAQSTPRAPNPSENIAANSVRDRYRSVLDTFYENERFKASDERARLVTYFENPVK